MNILFVGGYPNEIDRYHRVFFQNLIETIANQGHNCYVLAPISVSKKAFRNPTIKYERNDTTSNGTIVHIFQPKYISYSTKHVGKFNTGILSEESFQQAAVRCVKKLSQKKHFDCVYGHFFVGGGLAAIKIGNLLNIPSFVAFGECNYSDEVIYKYRELKSKDVMGLTGIISVSSANTECLRQKEIFNGIPISTIPNAIDPNLFFKKDKCECRAAMGFPQDSFIVGFVGGFINRKGDKRVLEAVNRIDNEKIFAVFAGKGQNKPSGEKVLFCNAVDHDRLNTLLNTIDVFVLPTLGEGCCNSIVEAMACGKPIISSRLPFNDDILNDKCSIRVDPNSIDEIEAAILKIMSNADIQSSMSEASMVAASDLTIARRAEKIIGFMQENHQK